MLQVNVIDKCFEACLVVAGFHGRTLGRSGLAGEHDTAMDVLETVTDDGVSRSSSPDESRIASLTRSPKAAIRWFISNTDPAIAGLSSATNLVCASVSE